MKLSDSYSIIDYIGSGSFGDVYAAIDFDGNFIAIKVENRNGRQKILREYRIYKRLWKDKFEVGLPKVYNFIVTPSCNIMSMQLLGQSLDSLYEEYEYNFKLSTIYNIAIQIITLLEQLHRCKYIHRDIKPNNFLIGIGEQDKQLYIMDFGLSKKYIINGKHIPMITGRSLIGTARYASPYMHQGIEPSRRDDLISVGYMLIYFCKGKLPWQGINKTKNFLDDIGKIKIGIHPNSLCEGLPDCFASYLSSCLSLTFTQDPNYTYLRSLFLNSALASNIEPSFEWI